MRVDMRSNRLAKHQSNLPTLSESVFVDVFRHKIRVCADLYIFRQSCRPFDVSKEQQKKKKSVPLNIQSGLDAFRITAGKLKTNVGNDFDASHP